MIFGAGCCTCAMLRTIFVAAQPSHSDDFSNARSESVLTPVVTAYPDFDDNLMVIR